MGQNPTAPEIPILLDKERHLRFDFNAAAIYEEVTGLNLFGGGALSKLSATSVRALVFACLQHEEEPPTLKQVGSWIHFGNMAEVTAKVGALYAANAPVQESEERPPVPPGASPGSAPGQ